MTRWFTLGAAWGRGLGCVRVRGRTVAGRPAHRNTGPVRQRRPASREPAEGPRAGRCRSPSGGGQGGGNRSRSRPPSCASAPETPPRSDGRFKLLLHFISLQLELHHLQFQLCCLLIILVRTPPLLLNLLQGKRQAKEDLQCTCFSLYLPCSQQITTFPVRPLLQFEGLGRHHRDGANLNKQSNYCSGNTSWMLTSVHMVGGMVGMSLRAKHFGLKRSRSNAVL